MKRNLFIVVFIFFASVVFYKFGRRYEVPTPHDSSNHNKISKNTEHQHKEKVPPKAEATPLNKQTQENHPKENSKETKAKITQKTPISLTPVNLSQYKGELKELMEIKNDVLAAIPKKEDLSKLNEKTAHAGLSPQMIKAGQELGRFKSYTLRYPDQSEVQNEAQSFYEQCAGYNEYPNSIRSLCLYNRVVLAKNKGESFDTSSYPEQIKKVVHRKGM
ncbi:MAG: hypothetical protein CME60_14480 [Halobacteriovoraceae bacterium]|nr:hypothetical protein [Halobacteriovoraceae bacterium]